MGFALSQATSFSEIWIGVCIIPRAAEEEVVRKALEKAREESILERALREGMSATEAFARYGIM